MGNGGPLFSPSKTEEPYCSGADNLLFHFYTYEAVTQIQGDFLKSDFITHSDSTQFLLIQTLIRRPLRKRKSLLVKAWTITSG